MIAPFKDLQKVKTGEIKEGYGSVERKSVLESEFNSIDEAKKLLDALIKYYENHPDIQGHAQRETQEARERSLSRMRMDELRERSGFRRSKFFHSDAVNIDGIIDFYLKNLRFCSGFPKLYRLIGVFRSFPLSSK